MNKTKFLTFAVLGLLILNTALITILLIGGRRPHRENIRNIVVKRLQFDEKQAADYKILIENHKTEIQKKENEMKESKKQLYFLLSSNDLSKKDSFIQQICLKQHDLEGINFQHFLEIKNLCKAEQIPEFNAFAIELGQLFSPKHKER
jgi:periplasmic protein CpxP/Spy